MLRLLWLVLLVTLLTVSGICTDTATNAAIATASGSVTLNGKVLARSSAVFPGDTLATSSASALVLQGKSYSLQAGPGAGLSIQRDALSLTSGAVRVTGVAVIKASDITIIGNSFRAKFLIEVSQDGIQVTAEAGTVTVHEFKVETRIEAGQTRKFHKGSQSHETRSAVLTAGGAAGIAGLVAYHLEDEGSRCISNCGLAPEH